VTIRSKLILSVIVFGIIAFVVAITLIVTFRHANELIARETTADKLLLEAHDLSELSNDYIFSREKRPGLQWEAKYNSMAALLALLRTSRPEEQVLVDSVASNHKRLKEIFNNVRATVETEAVSGQDRGDIGFLQLSWSRLTVQTQGIILDASQLAHLIGEDRRAARYKSTLLIVAMVGMLIVFILVNYLFIYWRVLRSVETLREGTKIIGSGNLDYRIEETSKDEIGDLARAFNQMNVNLATVLASKEELNREVEERRRAEDQLKKTLADLERSNKELEQFAYVASHDLQEPLRMVSSYTQLLAERYENQLDDKAKKFINYAVDGAVRMQQLIQDLLSFSRVTTRGEEFQAIDSGAALGMAMSSLGETIQQSGALVTNDDDFPQVMADQTQLARVFQNLISNAIKFRGQKQPRIHVSVQEQDLHWLFSVEDNGIGIDPRYSGKVFVIFQRLHTREEYPGTGIGLALCERIIKRHGGKIWFDSKPGEGSTFYFTFPKRTEEGHSDEPKTQH
jgi:signal transduction histidine kinase